LVCNTTSNDTCLSTYCDANWTLTADEKNGPTGPCTTVNVCTISALIGGLAGGIVAAIVIAALIGFATCAGGSYAAANLLVAEDDVSLSTNPVYINKGVSGTNPLHVDP